MSHSVTRKQQSPERQRRLTQRLHERSSPEASDFRNIKLLSEDIAEFEYQPGACGQMYRMVVIRTHLSVEQGHRVLYPDIRCVLYKRVRIRFSTNASKERAHRCWFSDTNMSAKDSDSQNSTMRLAVASD